MNEIPIPASGAPDAAPDSDEAIARDVAAIGRLGAVPAMLNLICQHTGMGFAAVARVTRGRWTACAVQDNIQFGLKPGGSLEVGTTLCVETLGTGQPIVFDNASADPLYCNHHTPRLYKIQSYISVPILLRGGAHFGNLCAIDPEPHRVSDERTLTMFKVFADLIAVQLASELQQRATERELLDERATAELREQFIAVLGHDLRNPLNTVGMVAALLEAPDKVDLPAVAARLKSVTRRMSRLIDDVLDFARGRLGNGLGVAHTEVRDLGGALREVVAEVRQAHPEGSISDRIAVTGPVQCDRGRMQQLLANLLDNALAYGSGDRPVEVEVSVKRKRLVIRVTNWGNPIPPQNLEKIFEPYWRAAGGRPGGLGLGMYICAQIVKGHGGTLQVASTAAEGTTFHAEIPVAAPAS